MHRPALVVAIKLQTRAIQRPPRHVQSLAPVRAAAADDVNALMTQLNAAVQQEDFLKAADLKKRLDALRGDDGGSNNNYGYGDNSDNSSNNNDDINATTTNNNN